MTALATLIVVAALALMIRSDHQPAAGDVPAWWEFLMQAAP